MVEDLHAVLAGRAVTGPFRTANVASITETSGMRVLLRNDKVFLVLLWMELKKGASRDDARIGARREVHEEVHEEDAEEKDDGQRGVDAPVFAHHEDAEGNDDAQRAAVDVDHARNVLARTGHTAIQVKSVGRRENLVYFRHVILLFIIHLKPTPTSKNLPKRYSPPFTFLQDLRPLRLDGSLVDNN